LEGTQGIGVVLAETTKAAESVISAFRQLDANILVQEYIREAKGEDVRAFVVGDKIPTAMVRQAPRGEFRANIHRGAKARRTVLSKEEHEMALKAAHVLGLEVAGVDFLRTRRGPMVIEVNASPGLEGIEGATRVRLAEKIIAHLEHLAEERSA